MPDLAKRFMQYVPGIFILALGTVLFSCCQLGVSSLVSVPFTTATITGLTLGNATSLVFGLLAIVEIILVKSFPLKIFLQLPFSFLFGAVVDFYNVTLGLGNFVVTTLVGKVLLLMAAVIATSVGSFLMVNSKLILNPPDGLVEIIALKKGKRFGQVKFYFDLTMITVAFLLGMIFLGQPSGIGVGTLVALLLVGRLIHFIELKTTHHVREETTDYAELVTDDVTEVKIP
ncbi:MULTISPECIES: YczE/YyaS/YitT family protein [Enterococcus]|jgi:hypothetical protein|uniref:YczE/YyaS/YitT family protein n=1 Tax=Enterococcus TaxID=1350 RepID=UPI00189DAEFE|nr:DUF6198 family protein [Enterococcus dispar]MCU7357880.1 DUF6198 family protein [Enterococcus dispar]MDT2706108.1 DUF6198 family protein [Enterococcus dispar]